MATSRMLAVSSLVVALVACGGPEDGDAAGAGTTAPAPDQGSTPPPPSSEPPPSEPPPPPAPPATFEPAAVVTLLRESFGPGIDGTRPSGGKGELRSTMFVGIDGFWAEYPGRADVAWSAVEQGWKFAGCSVDPHEAPSPLQPYNGCAVSEWTDGSVRFPVAAVPFSGAAGAYELSAELYPGVLAGASVSLGLSGSTVTANNLGTAGQAWIVLRQGPALDGIAGEWELRVGGSGGRAVATGTLTLQGYNRVVLRHDPVAGTVSVIVVGAAFGPFDAPDVAPRAVVVEGQGVVDDLVVRAVP